MLAKSVRHFWKDFSTNSTTYLQKFQRSETPSTERYITSQQHGPLLTHQSIL